MSTMNINIKVVHENEIVSVGIDDLMEVESNSLGDYFDRLVENRITVVDEEGEWEVGPLMDIGVQLTGIDEDQPNHVLLQITGIREWTQYEEEQ